MHALIAQLVTKNILQLWEKRLVRGNARSILVGFAEHYSRQKAYRRHVAARSTCHDSLVREGKLVKSLTIEFELLPQDPMSALQLQLEPIHRLVAASPDCVVCTEHKTFKWGDDYIKPGRYFAFEDEGCFQVGCIFSLCAVKCHHSLVFRRFTEFEISNGSVHITVSSIQPDTLEIIEFPCQHITLSRSQVCDDGIVHMDL